MKPNRPTRLCLGAALALVCGAMPALARGRERGFGPPPPPPRVERHEARQEARQAQRQAPNNGVARPPQPNGNRPPEPGVNRPVQPGVNRPVQPGAGRPGLQQWMENHRNLPPAEQLRELQNDPTFRSLPPQQQQGALNEMRRLQTMSPEQLNRRQALLRMSPEQRQQFSAAMYQYATLPPPRQRIVGRAFASLRGIPPRDRAAAMSSYPPLQQLSPQERQTLSNMLSWAPYMAPAGQAGRP